MQYRRSVVQLIQTTAYILFLYPKIRRVIFLVGGPVRADNRARRSVHKEFSDTPLRSVSELVRTQLCHVDRIPLEVCWSCSVPLIAALLSYHILN